MEHGNTSHTHTHKTVYTVHVLTFHVSRIGDGIAQDNVPHYDHGGIVVGDGEVSDP